MKIEKLRLKGFIGIKRGLGLDEINIDFSHSDGLVAFAGQNGLGKSTVLENLHPYNTLASRSGALFNHVDLRDSEKDLSFTYNGHEYRTLLKIDSQSGKSEGYIWKDGASMVNGNISAYAKHITKLFGSTNLFFNSVFCAQNSTKLSDMRTGELKALFAEFLRLDRLQEYEKTSKQVINVLTGKLSQIDVNLEVIKKRLDGAQGTQKAIDRLNVSLKEQKAAKAYLTEKLAADQKEREGLKEVIARNEVFRAQVADMKKRLEEMNGNRDREDIENGTKLKALRDQYLSIMQEIKDADAILASEAAIYAMTENKKALEELISGISASLDTATDEAAAAQRTVTGLEKDIQELKNSLKMTGNDARLSEIDRDITALKQKIAGYDKQLKALDARHPECTINGCSFIVAALTAQGELPAALDRLEQLKIDKENRLAELTAAATEISGQITEKENVLKEARTYLAEQQKLQTTKRQDLAVKRRELAQYQNVSEKMAALAVAKSKKEDRLRTLEENKKQGMAATAAWTERKTILDDQINAQHNKIAAIEDQINMDAADFLYGIEDKIKKMSELITGADAIISNDEKRFAQLQGELTSMQGAASELEKATAEKNSVAADIAEWTYIRNSCGKNGLQAMEIDGAAPIITGFANDLLSKAFGSLYTVKFRTQDDEGKECLDIITITDDGDEVLLDNLSGGQRTWILMALRLAMTLLSKEKGGRNFQTAFFDELDGPLDADNAVNFVHLYKSFMQIGHFDTVPFISHKQECRNLADHVLMFEAGKAPYWN